MANRYIYIDKQKDRYIRSRWQIDTYIQIDKQKDRYIRDRQMANRNIYR